MEFGFKTKQGRRNVLYCVIAILIAIVFLFPIYWLLSMSFKTDAESFGKIVTYYPHDFTLDPWVQNFSERISFIFSCHTDVTGIFNVNTYVPDF